MSQSDLDSPAVEVQGLRVSRMGGFELYIDTLRLERGSIVALIGPNGSGKSSLIEALAGLLPIERNRLDLLGRDLIAMSATDPARHHLGVQLQSASWSASLLVADILRIHQRVYGHVSAEIIGKLGIAELMDHTYGRLSVGQRRRVDLAVAIAHEPQVALLDEPTSGLDRMHAEQLRDCLTLLRSSGSCVIIATHSGEDASIADHALWISQGMIVDFAPPNALIYNRLGSFACHVRHSDSAVVDSMREDLEAVSTRVELRDGCVVVFGGDDLRQALPTIAHTHDADDYSVRPANVHDLLALAANRPVVIGGHP